VQHWKCLGSLRHLCMPQTCCRAHLFAPSPKTSSPRVPSTASRRPEPSNTCTNIHSLSQIELVCPDTHHQLSTLPGTSSGPAGEKRRPEQHHLRSTSDLSQTGTDLRLGLGSAPRPLKVDKPRATCRLRCDSDSPCRARAAGSAGAPVPQRADLYHSVQRYRRGSVLCSVSNGPCCLHHQPSRTGSRFEAGCTCWTPWSSWWR
jgi:hypothetical protein